MARLAADADPVARQHAALTFWEHLVDGADSLAFRLMFNGMRAAYLPLIDALASVMAAEVDRVEAYQALAEAVTAGRAKQARAHAEDVLGVATHGLTELIDRLEAEHD